MQPRRYLEFAVVIVVLGLLAWVLRERFDAIRAEARSVQLRMAAEAARSNAQLLQLKCPDWADRGCAVRALDGLRRAKLAGPQPGEPQRPPAWPTEAAQQRLFAIASATGLTQSASAELTWRLRPLGASRLEIALIGVIDCRFMLLADVNSHTVSVEDIQPRC